jgi:hypothetical protein
VDWENEPGLNVANGNFYHLWDLLGYTDYASCGHVTTQDLAERVANLRTRMLEQPGEWGRATTVLASGGGPTVINCGLPEEQIVYYLDTLEAVITRATELGYDVQFA